MPNAVPVSVLEPYPREAERQQVEYVPGLPDSLWSFFKTAEFWRGDLLLTPVLILDQFEELFTLQSEQRETSFLDGAELSHPRGSPACLGARPRSLSEYPPAYGSSCPCAKTISAFSRRRPSTSRRSSITAFVWRRSP